MLSRRPATAADEAFLRELHHRVYRDVVTRQFGVWDQRQQDEWFDQDKRDALFSLLMLDGVVVGAVLLNDFEDYIELAELQILPEQQNQGLGSSVLAAEQARARALGKPLRLRVLHENRARRLYLRHGFEQVGQSETHYLMEWQARSPEHKT